VGLGAALDGGSGVGAGTDTVDLLVDLGTVMVTVLTSARDLESNASRMPSTDTSDLAETAMGLAGQAGNTPTADDTGITVTFGDSEDIDVLVDGEDSGDGDGALEKLASEVDLSGNITTVDLDLNQVSLLLAKLEQLDLSVGQHADDVSMLFEASELSLNILVGLVGHAASIAIESFLLGTVPVLVEATLDGLVQVSSPDGGQGAESAGGVDISNETDNVQRGGLEDGDGLDGLALVEL
jgi:hypothetical protein